MPASIPKIIPRSDDSHKIVVPGTVHVSSNRVSQVGSRARAIRDAASYASIPMVSLYQCLAVNLVRLPP